jgi:type I restriction enzyme M protein
VDPGAQIPLPLRPVPRLDQRSALDTLTKKRLGEIATGFELEVAASKPKDDFIDAIASSRKASFERVLEVLSRDELKEICRAHDLDDGGRAKQVIIDRILGRDAAGEPAEAAETGSDGASAGSPPAHQQLELPTSGGGGNGNGNGRRFNHFGEVSSFIWDVFELLRGDYRRSEYGMVILPFTLLRRLDCVLDATKDRVLAEYKKRKGGKVKNIDPFLTRITGYPFFNISRFTMPLLLNDPNNIAHNLTAYIKGFPESVREIFIQRYHFNDQISKLDEANLLYQVVDRFAHVDLHPEVVPNTMMGSIFEELIRRFAEAANEEAGDFFTPREVIKLMVNLLFLEDTEVLTKPGIVRTLYDPAAGTGGMLSVAEEHVRELNPQAKLEVFGQELNDRSFAICKSDMMIKGQNPDNIKRGNSFSQDGHEGQRFDYMLSNPPFGVDWKRVQKVIEDEHESMGMDGRFGVGLPRINDGAMLFLQHMISKMKADGSRIAIVFNGSPMFTGAAESGESNIRKWIIENDWLEAIVGLPDQMFFNTGINTYIWLVTNKKPPHRQGKVQLINATSLFQKMKKSLGNKRNEMSQEHIDEVARIYGDFEEGKFSKIFDNEDFGYRRVTVERPLRLNFQASPERIERLKDQKAFANLATSKKKGAKAKEDVEAGLQLQRDILEALRSLDPNAVHKNRDHFDELLTSHFRVLDFKVPKAIFKAIMAALSERDEEADVCTDAKGNPEPDGDLRDQEDVPLKEDVHTYFEREVKPHLPDAWLDEARTKIGYEIPFTRHFYEFTPLPGQTHLIAARCEDFHEEVVVPAGLEAPVLYADLGPLHAA